MGSQPVTAVSFIICHKKERAEILDLGTLLLMIPERYYFFSPRARLSRICVSAITFFIL